MSYRSGRWRVLTTSGIVKIVPKVGETGPARGSLEVWWCWSQIGSSGAPGNWTEYDYATTGTPPVPLASLRPGAHFPFVRVDGNPSYSLVLVADVGAGHQQSLLLSAYRYPQQVFHGEYEMSCEMEEWVDVPDPTGPITHVDGRKDWSATLSERPRSGGLVRATITVNGYTVTDSATITDPTQGGSTQVLGPDGSCYYRRSRLWAGLTSEVTETQQTADLAGELSGQTVAYERDAENSHCEVLGDTVTMSGPHAVVIHRHPEQHCTLIGRVRALDGALPGLQTVQVPISQPSDDELMVGAPAQDAFYLRLTQGAPIYVDVQGPALGEWTLHTIEPFRPIRSIRAQLRSADLTATDDDADDVRMPLLLWPIENMVTMQQADHWDVDALDEVEIGRARWGYLDRGYELAGKWMGGAGEPCTVDGGIRIDAAAGSALQRHWVNRAVNLGGYRYLRFTLSGPECGLSVSIRSGKLGTVPNVTGRVGITVERDVLDRWGLTHSGRWWTFYTRTWSRDYQGNPLAPGTCTIDLCSPDSETALSDTYDMIWDNRGLDGPYFGVSHASMIEFGGLAAGTYRLSALQSCRIS